MKIVVFNNGALGFVELEMKATGFLDFGHELENPNFAAMAEAMGIHGIRVEDAGELEGGAARRSRMTGPALVDVVERAPGAGDAAQATVGRRRASRCTW